MVDPVFIKYGDLITTDGNILIGLFNAVNQAPEVQRFNQIKKTYVRNINTKVKVLQNSKFTITLFWFSMKIYTT